jgi:hypothetical protein
MQANRPDVLRCVLLISEGWSGDVAQRPETAFAPRGNALSAAGVSATVGRPEHADHPGGGRR